MENPLTLNIGSGLVPAIDPDQSGSFLAAIQYARLSWAVHNRKELPPISITDNNDLNEMSFRYAFNEVVFYEGVLKQSSRLYATIRRMTKCIPGELADVDDAFISEKYINVGKIVAEHDEAEYAIEYFQKAVQYNRENCDAYRWRGYCHQKLEQFEDAIDDYSASIDLGDCSAWPYRQRALCYDKLSMFKHAMEDNEMALAIELQDQ